jgi:REP element-mobilizing transposase RayT
MPNPLVIAYHLIWTGYGFWLPNDPRGSTSHNIRDKKIAELGRWHFGRYKKQPSSEVIREFQRKAAAVLKYPLLKFNQPEIKEITDAFADIINRQRYTCYACAIMPDHVHILIRKHKHTAEEMIENLQESSRLRLSEVNLRSCDHPIWGGEGWKVFLYHPSEVRKIIRYIEDNPVKWGLPWQKWPFVVAYNNWPLHPGHNPNSPYAKGLQNYSPWKQKNR